MEKVKISIVSYLNSIPFLYGLENSPSLKNQIEISKDIPSKTAAKLKNREVDLGLVPVAILPQLNDYHIVSDYCIGANGPVKSVVLLSEVPLNKIEKVYLDYHSRTSVNLCKVLCKYFWNIQVEFLEAEEGFEKSIKETIAGVVIGDRTFQLNNKFTYRFDLAEEWHKWKNLPFVFAAWVSNHPLEESFLNHFNNALKEGLVKKELAIENYPVLNIEKKDKVEYLNKYIDYHLDASKKESMNVFLNYLKEMQDDN